MNKISLNVICMVCHSVWISNTIDYQNIETCPYCMTPNDINVSKYKRTIRIFPDYVHIPKPKI